MFIIVKKKPIWLTLTAMMEIHAPWSLKAKYTPFLVTFTVLVSVLMTTSLLALNLPSPAAIRPVTWHRSNITTTIKPKCPDSYTSTKTIILHVRLSFSTRLYTYSITFRLFLHDGRYFCRFLFNFVFKEGAQ